MGRFGRMIWHVFLGGGRRCGGWRSAERFGSWCCVRKRKQGEVVPRRLGVFRGNQYDESNIVIVQFKGIV